MECPAHSSLRIAVFGGDSRQARRFRHVPDAVFYPAGGCAGPHHAQRLIDSIRHGGVDRILILVRWNGHSATRRIREVARAHAVPVTMIAGIQVTDRIR